MDQVIIDRQKIDYIKQKLSLRNELGVADFFICFMDCLINIFEDTTALVKLLHIDEMKPLINYLIKETSTVPEMHSTDMSSSLKPSDPLCRSSDDCQDEEVASIDVDHLGGNCYVYSRNNILPIQEIQEEASEQTAKRTEGVVNSGPIIDDNAECSLPSGGMDHFLCEICREYFSSLQDLANHKKECHNDMNGLFQCGYCDEYFATETDTLCHARMAHADGRAKMQTCSFCDMEFKTITEKNTHEKHHHSDHFQFSCSICYKRFRSSRLLNSHTKNAHSNQRYVCAECSSTFKTLANLKIHMTKHKMTEEMKARCWICDKSFTTNANLERHMKTHTGEKTATCDQCGKNFATNSDLKSHLVTHTGHRGYTCEYCGKMFKFRSNWTYHIGIHKDQSVRYSCPACNKLFKREKFVHRHWTQCHSNVQNPYTCSVDGCHLSFMTRQSLERHFLRHTGERPYPCEYCDKKFARSDVLKNHISKKHISKTGAIVNVTVPKQQTLYHHS